MTSWDALRRWMEPQERFELLRADTWRRGGARVVDLAYANAWDGPSQSVLAAMREALDQTRGALDFQYTPYGGESAPRRLVAHALGARTGLPFRFRHVVMTSGAMAALTVVFRRLALMPCAGPPELVIPTPCWIDYPLYAAQAGLVPKLVPLDPETLRLDVEALAAAVGPCTVGVVLSQPGNPTGLLHGEAELTKLAALLDAQPSQPWLISDECHRAHCFASSPPQELAQHHPRTLLIASFGKAAMLQGQRIGYVAVSPRAPDSVALAEDLARTCRATGVCTPTALMQRVVPALLEAEATVDMTKIEERRSRTLSALADAKLEVVPSQGSFFLYPRVPGGDAWDFATRLGARGVSVLPAEVFHHSGHMRISLTATDAMLEAGLEAIVQVAHEGS